MIPGQSSGAICAPICLWNLHQGATLANGGQRRIMLANGNVGYINYMRVKANGKPLGGLPRKGKGARIMRARDVGVNASWMRDTRVDHVVVYRW
jgi:hypothetical protein